LIGMGPVGIVSIETIVPGQAPACVAQAVSGSHIH
jgi:hypothetical protein